VQQRAGFARKSQLKLAGLQLNTGSVVEAVVVAVVVAVEAVAEDVVAEATMQIALVKIQQPLRNLRKKKTPIHKHRPIEFLRQLVDPPAVTTIGIATHSWTWIPMGAQTKAVMTAI
jgi:hypothetical protein